MSKDKALVGPRKDPVRYSKRLCHQIHTLYLQGYSITAISKLPGMPSANSIWQWAGEYAFFKELMKDAREQRRRKKAEEAEERLVDLAQRVIDKDEAPGARVHLDVNKWIAEVNDPLTYGKKVTHAGDSNNPIQFIVSTGFPEPNAHQTPPELGSDGLIKKSGADAPLKEEG